MQHSPAQRIGRYRLLEPVGSGPNGTVARANVVEGSFPENEFAVKRFLPELTATPHTAQALETAARSYATLDDPRIARLSEFEVAPGQTFTAVEWVPGLDAKRLLTEAKLVGHRIAPGSALTLIANTARAVGYAHAQGVPHLGLSPTNMMVTAAGDVKVMDFGILAATVTSRPSDVPRLAHRIAYFSPEQLLGEETSPASDVFSLAAIAHELVTGQRAFAGNHARALSQAILAGPPVELQLPRPIVSVFDRCFARSPRERFSNAHAFADALEAALAKSSLPGTPRDLAAFVQTILGESLPAATGASEAAPPRGTSFGAPPSPNAAAGRRPAATPPVARAITTPPPIPALRNVAYPEGATLLGVPGAHLSNAPPKGTSSGAPMNAGFTPSPQPLGVTIRGAAPAGNPAQRTDPTPHPQASAATQKGAGGGDSGRAFGTGQHPVTSPPFQNEPTTQIPPELVQDLLNASLPDEATPASVPLLDTDPSSDLFQLPDDDDPPPTDANPLRTSRERNPLLDSHVDLKPQRRRSLWPWGVGLAAVGIAGGFLWRTTQLQEAPTKATKSAGKITLPSPIKASSTPAPAKRSAPLATPKPAAVVVANSGSGASAAARADATAAGSGATPTPIAPNPGSPSATPTPIGPNPGGRSATSTPTGSTGAASSNPPPQATDVLSISSSPPGARVFLDGANQGVTPVKVPGSSDRHTIAALLAGHELYLGESDGHGALQIALKPVTPTGGPAGIKVIRCKDKDRYYVFVDGKPTGMTCPTERIECGLGRHTVEVYDLVTENRRKWDIVVSDTRLSYRVRVD